MYWIGKPGQMYGMKLNANCSKEEKNGEGPGSCGGKVTGEKNSNSSNSKQFLGMSTIEKSRGERLDLPNYTKGPWLIALGETKLPPDDKGYYYHATTSDRLDSIIDIGIKAGISKPNFPSEINNHMDEVFLSKRLNDIPGEPYGAEYWSRMIFRSNKNKPIILRIKESSLKNVNKYGNEYEYRTKDPISSDNLEILKYGRWIPLTDIKSKLHQKLNYNCPDSEKSGEGKGSCGGSQSDKKGAGKSSSEGDAPKPSNMNARDIISRVQSGGKITKEEHAYITALMNGEKPKASEPVSKPVPVSKPIAIQKVPKKELVSNTKKAVEKVKAEMKAGKVSQKSVNELKKAVTEIKQSKETKKPAVTKNEQPDNGYSSGSGLSKIQKEIEKAGGPEAFFKTADTHSKGQDERKPIDSEQMSRIVGLYTNKDTFKTPYKEENGVKWYKQDNADNSIIVAKVGKKIAAYAMKAADADDPKNPYTTIVAATDFKGKGIGKSAMLEFYDNYPDMIKKTGGLTPMGKEAYLKTLKTIANGHKQNMAFPGFTTSKDLDIQLGSILKSIEPDVMKAIKKLNLNKNIKQ